MAQDQTHKAEPSEADHAGKDDDANSGKSGYVPGQGSRANQARRSDETSARQPSVLGSGKTG